MSESAPPNLFMGDLAEAALTVDPDVPVRRVKDLFDDDDLQQAVVVVEAEVPVGLVMASHLDRILTSQFGALFFYDQAVTAVMDPGPLIVEDYTTIETASRMAMAREKSRVYDHVIVRREGRLLGLTPVWKLCDRLSLAQVQAGAQLRRMNRRLHEGLSELQRAQSARAAADTVMGGFLARLSHDLLTPMNAILGMTDLLGRALIEPQHLDFVQILRSSSVLLLSVVNDLLDFFKIEDGQMELERITFDLGRLVEETGRILAYRAHAKKLDLVVKVDEGLPGHVAGDPTRLRQVLVNLVGNAIKFTDKGEVVLSAFPAPRSEGADTLLFSVHDTGPGLDPDRLAELLDGAAAGPGEAAGIPAAGLGLPISQKIIEFMGGRLWARSQPGQGALFQFTARLPQVNPSQDVVPVTNPDLTARRVLVASPRITARTVTVGLLARWGAVVDEASDAREAAGKMTEAARQKAPYHLLLVEANGTQPPGMELAVRLVGRPAAPVCLVMTDTSDAPQIRERLRAADRQACLVHPITRADLGAVLLGFFPPSPRSPGTDAAPPAPEPPALPALSVLLAEDYAPNRRLVQLYLKATPVFLEIAENGQAAVDLFKTGRYDLVLMDLEMPIMNGLDATRAIRSWEKALRRKPTPLFALTAYSLASHRQEAESAGANGFLHKPLSRETLMDTLWKIAGERSGEEKNG